MVAISGCDGWLRFLVAFEMPVVGMPAFRTGMVGQFVLAESTHGWWKDKASGASAVGFRLALSGWDGWLRFSSVLHGTHRRDCHGHQAFAGGLTAELKTWPLVCWWVVRCV
ncbi:unnamed protein product [Cuscuta campestris]|uniref:Uncharacterized protein n=2 Tax=Cuscuta campestris TaxID=132261 RepID=A0A484NHF4_9ASTE|nr:unnamed protein product [Cuscuta campestris]VFR00561.1 unnamed protein product [Cuscuta campestris]